MTKYDFMMNLMVRAPFYLSKLTIPHMKESNDGRAPSVTWLQSTAISVR